MGYSRMEKLRLMLGDDYELSYVPALSRPLDSASSDLGQLPSANIHNASTQPRVEKRDRPFGSDLPKSNTHPSPEVNVALPIVQTEPSEEKPSNYPVSNLPQTINAYDPISQPLIGTLAKPGESFCPIITISKYPYKYIRNEQIKEQIADGYFNGGKFWRRVWDLFVFIIILVSVRSLLTLLQILCLANSLGFWEATHPYSRSASFRPH